MAAAAPAKAAQPIRMQVNASPRQVEMINHPARVLWIGAGTKTGKTIALEIWIAQGILNREPTAWCGSILAKTRKAYLRLKQMLAPAAEDGELRFNDTNLTIHGKRGECLFYGFSGESDQQIYGDAYKRFVVDEASRQTDKTYTAALTTTSAKNIQGKIRIAFNLDHGARNWAVSNLLRVSKLTPEERVTQSVDFMMFPTLAEAWVDADEVERIRTSGMPKVMFDALYNAIIPTEDASLFKHLEELWSGPAPIAPERGHTYVMGVDLARKQNWTVATVLDVTASRFVAAMRFTQLDWTVQYERLAEFYRFWNVSRAWVDQTGIGDPVVEQLEQRKLAIEGVVFSEPKRRELIEGLIFGCDGRQFTVADTPELNVHKQEIDSFEVTLSKDGKLRFAVPEGHHDDAAFSMMLAWYGKRQGNFGRPIIQRMSEAAAVSANDFSAY